MEYKCLYVVNIGSDEADYTYAGVDGNGLVVEEPWDHGLPLLAVTKGNIELESKKGDSKWFTELNDDDIKISVMATDSRLVFYCKDYDKGGKWIGGATALIANAVEKGIAKARSRGKVMVGHIRYEWLAMVGFIRKTGWLSAEQVTLVYKDTDELIWRLALTFPKGTDTGQIANTIVHKAAIYRRAMTDEKSESEIEFNEAYAKGKRLVVENPKEFSQLFFPNYYHVPSGEKYRPDPGNFAGGGTA